MSKRKNKRYDTSFVTKLGVGFDPVLDTIEAVESTTTLDSFATIPPFNIKKTTDKDYCVEISLPGVHKENIDATLDADYLTVGAKVKEAYDPEGDDLYLHQGIFHGGKFEAKFVIAKNLQHNYSELVDGILRVWFVDKNEPRTSKKLAIGPFPVADVEYEVTYNSSGSPVLVPVGESPNSNNAVDFAPVVVVEEPAPVVEPEVIVEPPVGESPVESVLEPVVEEVVPVVETVDVVVNADVPTEATVEVTIPTEMPQIVEVTLDEIVPSVDVSSPEPQVSVTLTDATYEVSDNVTLEVIKTPEGTPDIVVAIPEEVKATLDEQNINILPAIEEAIKSEEVTPPVVVTEPEKMPEPTEVEVVPQEELKPETLVTVLVPETVTPVMEATVVSDDLGSVISLTPADTAIPADTTLVPVVTPEGQNDIVVAVPEEVKVLIEDGGHKLEEALSNAVIEADVKVAETPLEVLVEEVSSVQ